VVTADAESDADADADPDPDADALARQGTDAANSVVLNLGESNGRFGADRLHLCRIALGSLREVGAVLDIAAAHGWLESPPLALERDRLCGMLYGLERR
jgi:four helix bundle protein